MVLTHRLRPPTLQKGVTHRITTRYELSYAAPHGPARQGKSGIRGVAAPCLAPPPGGWRPLRSRPISPLRGMPEESHPGGWGLCRRGPPGRCAGVNTGVPGPAQSTAQRRSKPRSAPRPRGEGSGTRRGRGAGLTACGKTHAAFERRSIPPEPRRFAALCVAFRSKYTRYSSLTRLVSRAPPRSRRSPGFHHRLLAAGRFRLKAAEALGGVVDG